MNRYKQTNNYVCYIHAQIIGKNIHKQILALCYTPNICILHIATVSYAAC